MADASFILNISASGAPPSCGQCCKIADYPILVKSFSYLGNLLVCILLLAPNHRPSVLLKLRRGLYSSVIWDATLFWSGIISMSLVSFEKNDLFSIMKYAYVNQSNIYSPTW